MGFLQRLVNGGGYVSREYGIGRGRVDLLVRWPYTDAHGRPAAVAAEEEVVAAALGDAIDSGARGAGNGPGGQQIKH